jgi:hypothetical protein
METFENASITTEGGEPILTNLGGHVTEGRGWVLLKGRPADYPLETFRLYLLDTGDQIRPIKVVDIRHTLMAVSDQTEVHFRFVDENGKVVLGKSEE